MDATATIDVLRHLIEFPSVSSVSNDDISQWVAGRLQDLGFQVERTEYLDEYQVNKVNLVARRDPESAPTQAFANNDSPGSGAKGGLAYFCHTDVVPAEEWTGPGEDPFQGVMHQDRLYGRGACDMKGSLAAMLSAAASVSPQDQVSPLWIVCTADEEVGFAGAKHVAQHSAAFQELIKQQPLGIIGEPTGLSVVHAHKGITGFHIISHGRAAHSSTRDGINATLAMVPMLQTLLELYQRTENDPRYHDHRFDPPTLSWNFGVRSSQSAVNVTPSHCEAWVMFRPMPEIDGADLVAEAKARAEELGLLWRSGKSGQPVWVDPTSPCIETMCQLVGSQPATVCYGTDGGEFTALDQLLVCGPGHIAQAHTTDEWISVDQLQRGIELYSRAIRQWCC